MAEKKKKIIWLEPFLSAQGFYEKMGMSYCEEEFMYYIPASIHNDSRDDRLERIAISLAKE